jgi:exosortase A
MSVGVPAETGITLPRAHPLGPAVPLALALLAWGIAFQAEIVAAVQVWTRSTAYNHGFLVLPLALWLAWDRRSAAAAVSRRPTPWPVLAALPLGLAWFAAERLGLMEGRQLAALGLLEALLVAWLGWTLARAFAAALAYLVFLVPFGAFLTPALQAFTAHFVDAGLAVLAIPHVVTDLVIEIPEGRFYVAEACAGLRFLVAAVAFGTLYAALIYRSPGRRLAFLAASVVVPILANGFRALGIVVLGHLLGSAEAGAADHLIYGWGFFSAILLLLVAAGLPFREDHAPPAARPSAPRPHAAQPGAGWVALMVALVAAGGPLAAARFNRTAAVPVLGLPGFTATADCPSLGGKPEAVQHFRCRDGLLTTSLRALPAGTGPASLQQAMLEATGERGLGDTAVGWLDVAGIAPPSWRLVQDPAGTQLAATAVFARGAPLPGGLAGRFALAWNGLATRAGPVVLVAVALAADTPGSVEARRRVLQNFLAAQGELALAVARASLPGGESVEAAPRMTARSERP